MLDILISLLVYSNKGDTEMRRAKLGDVYYMKVTSGYKIYQWAYRIPKRGDYIRVFDGLYKEVPDKEYIEKLIKTEHSYIIGFNAGRAYRTELAYLIDSFPIPEEYPFPEYMVRIFSYGNGIHKFDVSGTENFWDGGSFEAKSINDLPEKFRNIKLLNSYPTASWIMYLFEIGFNLNNPELFWPGSVSGGNEITKKYEEIVENALLKEKQKKANRKSKE